MLSYVGGKVRVGKIFYLRLILASCLFVISIFLYTHEVSADEFSWINGKPTIISTQPQANRFGSCKDFRYNFDIYGIAGKQKGCLYDGGSIRFAYYYAGGSNYTGAISYGFDRKMYKVNDICGEFASCQYLPETDTMIAKYYVYPSYKQGLAIYKGFSHKLYAVKDSFGQVLEYDLIPNTNPDFIFQSSSGYNWPIGSVGSSENGSWIAAELKGRGMILINTSNFNVKKFSNTQYAYNVGFNPEMQLAVSDDGNYVVVAGQNVAPEVYEINNNCGTNVVDDEGIENSTLNPCQKMLLTNSSPSFSENLRTIYDPEFDSSGSEVKFFASYNDPSQNKMITLLANGATNPEVSQLDYLALGDSYSSGEGDTEQTSTGQKHYLASTDENGDYAHDIPREKCHQSDRAWPFLLADNYNIPVGDKFESVACSGAQIYDINSSNSTNYEGQGMGSALIMWSDGGKPRLKDIANKEMLKSQALNEFIPGRQKQIEFVKKYQPKIVTLTIGGNDVDFGGIIGKCVYQSDCEEASEQGRKRLGSDIKKQFQKLSGFYTELHQASINTKIYVLGYPQIILDRDDVQCPVSVYSLSINERKLMAAGYWYINQVIKTAAQKAGIQYIDTSNAIAGHRLCESDDSYANGVIAGAASKDERQESFHPNAKANKAIANKVSDIIGSQGLINYVDYPSGPDDLVTEKDIPNSDYLETSTSSVSDSERQIMAESTQTRSQTTNLSLQPFSLQPGSTTNVTLHSDSIDLGKYIANDDGSLNISVTIPGDMPVGYHRLVVSGKTYSGEPIEFEQTILIENQDANDKDANGIPDNQQVCGLFIETSNQDKDRDGIDDVCDPVIGFSKQAINSRNGKTDSTHIDSTNTHKHQQPSVNNDDQPNSSENTNTHKPINTPHSNNQNTSNGHSPDRISNKNKSTRASSEKNIQYLVTVLSFGSIITTAGCVVVWLL